MSDESSSETDADVGTVDEPPRTTAPMSEFTTREATIGIVVALLGVAIVFGVPTLAI